MAELACAKERELLFARADFAFANSCACSFNAALRVPVDAL